MDEIVGQFLAESNDCLDRLDQTLLDLVERTDDVGTLTEAFRILHTIKETYGFLGFGRLELVAQRGENLLSLLRDSVLELNDDVADALHAIVAAIREILVITETAGTNDNAALTARLEALSSRPPSGSPAKDKTPGQAETIGPRHADLAHGRTDPAADPTLAQAFRAAGALSTGWAPGQNPEAESAGDRRDVGADNRQAEDLGPADHVIDDRIMLLVDVDEQSRAAIPISAIERLEAFDADQIDDSGHQTVVQYRDSILPILDLGPATGMGSSALGVGPRVDAVVCHVNGISVGLAVGSILDIVPEAEVKEAAGGTIKTAIVNGHVTDVINAESLLQRYFPMPEPIGSR